MPEVISLASFDFDSTRLEKTLSDLQVRMVALQKEQRAVSSSMKENDALFKVGAKSVEDYNKTNQQLFDTQKDLQRQQAVVNKEYRTAATLQQQLIDSDNKRISSTQALNNALNAEIKTIAEARKNNKDLLAIRNQLDLSTKEGVEQLGIINTQLDKNNEFIKSNVSAYEKQKINIGNYTQSIKEAITQSGLFGGKIQQVTQVFNSFSPIFNTINNDIKNTINQLNIFGAASQEAGDKADDTAEATQKLSNGQKALAAGMNVATGAVRIFTVALAATGIGVLIGGIALLISTFKSFTPLIDKVEQGMAAAGAAFNVVKNAIISLVTGAKSFTDVFKNLGSSMMEAAVAAAQLAKAQQDLDDITDQLTVASAKNRAEINRLNIQAKDRTKTEEERIALLQKASKIEQLDFDLRKKVSDGKLNLAYQEIAIAAQLSDSEIEQLKKSGLAYKEVTEQKTGNNDELYDNLKNALLESTEIENEFYSNQEKNINRQNKLIEDAEAEREKASERQLKAQDEAIQKQREAIDLFVAQQGDRARTLQEQLDLDRQIADKQKAVLDAELKAKKISYEKYQTEVININNEISKKQEEIIVESAQRELDEFIKLNQSKLSEGQLLTEELLEQELSREQSIQAQRDAFSLEQRNQGLINEQQYQDSLLATKEEYLLKEQELNKTFEDQQKAQRELNRALEFESQLLALEENAWTEFERKQMIADQQRSIEEEKLKSDLANDLITTENFLAAMSNLEAQSALVSEKIDKEKNQYKIGVASQTFGNLATIAGKETAAGKAFAIAQTTIDTYASAVAAYKSLAGIPVYGPVLGGIAAGAAVASGLKSVKDIASTPVPSASGGGSGGGTLQAPRIQGFAEGGVVNGGIGINRSNGDNVLITAKKGEVILNEQQRNIIGSELLSFAGVPGFANGGLIGALPSNQQSVQSLITQGFDATLISEAVKEGAREGSLAGSYEGSSKGSQDGIVDLSTNRLIQAQATF